MNLRHIDPRSTEWMETIEEITEREGDEEEGKRKTKSGDVLARSAKGTSSEPDQMTAPGSR